MLKQLILPTLFFMFFTNINAQKTYVPDDNFEQYLIDQGIDSDGTVNDSVKTSDISGVLHLVVNSKNISDLTGIKDFTGLLDIDCRDNQLTSVDLTHNTKLKMFNAGKNQLTNLDLSHNTELTWLNCAENELTSLNFNQNIKITFLKCDKNSINALDVSLLSGLQYLTCNNNQLTTLNIGGNKLLERLTCGKNKLAELDLHLNTALTNVRCDSNRIVNLNITNAQNLTDLDCSNNKITSLDISHNTALVNLNCSVNSLASIDPSKSTTLEELICSVNLITSLDVSKNAALNFLDCGGNPITKLDLSHNTNLSSAFVYGTSLTDLDLSSNSALTMVFCGYSQYLRTINVNNSNNGIISYFDVSHSPALTCIIVDNPAGANSGSAPYNTWVKDETAKYKSECNVQIRNTYVPDNNFEQALIDLGIDIDGTLNDSVSTDNIYAATSLDVSNKNISDFTGIEEFINLTNLYVSDNQLTKIDLSKNVKLKILRCDNNQLSELNLQLNNLLTEIKCNNNQLTDLILLQNNNLKKLYCNNNLLTDLDMRLFNALTELNCSHNQLTSLNVQNGTNNLITAFDATNNPDLTCIPVDNATDANDGKSPYNTWQKDDGASYSERCDIPGFTYIPDDNFEQALINLGIDKDGIVNDYVATADIKGVSSLNVSNKNISDLTGIEDFTNLTDINCSFNQLSSLNINFNTLLTNLSCNNNNLTSLIVSQNTALKTLFCGYNNITNLDITKNTSLTALDCIKNNLNSLDVSQDSLLEKLNVAQNHLSELDVSNNHHLQYLWCYENKLTELDLSQNSELINAYCSDNELVWINVKNGNNLHIINFDVLNNPLLTCISVDNSAVANAGMAPYDTWIKDATASYSFDCSDDLNVFIPDANFEQALIDLGIDTDTILNDSIAKADIAGVTILNLQNKNISNLSGIEYFSDLLKLNVGNNQLTSLDVTQNILLQKLICKYNDIENLDLSQNKALHYFDCEGNSFAGIDVSENTDLDSLNCSFNVLTALNVTNNVNLKLLSCVGNQLTNLDLTQNTALTSLSCFSNLLTSLNINNNDELTQLKCNRNQIASLDLTHNSKLTLLDCAENNLNTIDLSNNVLLQNIECFSNQLTNLDLSNNTKLEKLQCDRNQLTKLNTSGLTELELLFCYNNQITDIDISDNTSLTVLTCFDNYLTNLNLQNGENTILHTLMAKNNPDLLCIQVDNEADANNGMPPYDNWQKDATAGYSNDCTQETAINDPNFEQALIDLGIINDTGIDGNVLTVEIASVTKLDLSGLNITDLTGIADFTALDTLILADNQITYLDLTNNPNLVYLDVSGNPIETLLVIDEEIIKDASLIETTDTTNENLLFIDISETNISSFNLSYFPNLETFLANNSKLDSLDVSGNTNLTVIDLRSCPLSCIQVSQTQLDNIPAGWQKEALAFYSIDCSAASAINEQLVNEISLYPSPVSNILHVESIVPITRIEFYSVTGEILKVSTSNFRSINMNNLREGMYVAKIFAKDRIAVRKLIKQ